jgi:hypothetical protein
VHQTPRKVSGVKGHTWSVWLGFHGPMLEWAVWQGPVEDSGMARVVGVETRTGGPGG